MTGQKYKYDESKIDDCHFEINMSSCFRFSECFIISEMHFFLNKI